MPNIPVEKMQSKNILEFLTHAVKAETEKIYKARMSDIAKELQERQAEVLASVVLQAMKMVDIQQNTDRTVITLRTQNI